jgi:hypothetical protein
LKCCGHTLGLLFRSTECIFVCVILLLVCLLSSNEKKARWRRWLDFFYHLICARLLTNTRMAWPDCRTHPQPLRTQGKAAAREKRVHSQSRQLQLRTDFVGRLCGRVHELVRLALPTLPRFEMPGPSWEAAERAAGDSLNRVRAGGR